ncbi:MAG: hypothetical protein HY814_13295 [Candidatus Riflebacteria bacterium]|nr:hypothetical protein [Candidatus Riflebacteria bacterium]
MGAVAAASGVGSGASTLSSTGPALASDKGGAAIPSLGSKRDEKDKYYQTDFTYEVYEFNRLVPITVGGALPVRMQRNPVTQALEQETAAAYRARLEAAQPYLVSQQKTRARVSRFTATETFGWKLGSRWSLEAEAPYSQATYRGMLGDLQRPPTLTPSPAPGLPDGADPGAIQASLVDVDGRQVYLDPSRAASISLQPSFARGADAHLEIQSFRDLTLHPRYVLKRPGKNGNNSWMDLAVRAPTGKSRLDPDEQLLVTALGEASMDVSEPYFGKGFDLGARLNFERKASDQRQWNFTLGFTKTGTYSQAYSPQLNTYFDQGIDNLESLLEDAVPLTSTELRRLPLSPTGDTRLVTKRDPADQAYAGIAMTVRPSAKRRDQYALTASGFFGETAINPAGIAFGDVGDAAPSKVDLEKDPTLQFSYTQDRKLSKKLFGRLRVFYQYQGISDVLPPTGFVVRNVDFGDRYGGDLQFRRRLGVPGATLSYGLRLNQIEKARLMPGQDTSFLTAPLGLVNSDRQEMSTFLGWDRERKEHTLGLQLRIGVTDDAPDLVLQGGLRKQF